MPRYNDRQLEDLRRFADATKAVAASCDLEHFLSGKGLFVEKEILREEEARAQERAAMFLPPDDQLKAVRAWNAERRWGFREEDFQELAASVPPPPPAPSDGRLQLTARVLEVALPATDGVSGPRRTLEELWRFAARQPGVRPLHLFDPDQNPQLDVVPAPEAAHVAGLRWRIVDFGGRVGEVPRRLPAGAARPGAAVLSAAALFPLWLARMDGIHVPYAWVPGLRFEGLPNVPSGFPSSFHHPVLTWSGQGLLLYTGWDHTVHLRHAIPTFVANETGP